MIVDKPWGKVATYALNQPSSVRSSRWSPDNGVTTTIQLVLTGLRSKVSARSLRPRKPTEASRRNPV